jgi:hypothetical protein
VGGLFDGNGIKTIYFKVKDKVGNEAKPVAASILMNITTPDSDTDISQISASFEFWTYLFVIIIIIILVFIITTLVMVIRKKKRAEPEILPMGAVTIRPQGYIDPVSSVQQVPTTTQYPQLAGQPTVYSTSISTVAQTQTPVPVLTKSTQTAQPTLAPQPTPQVQVVPQPVPQLPPAQVQVAQTPKPTIAPKPTLITAPTIQQSPEPTISGPTPTVAQSTVATSPTPPTPTLATPPESTNGPVVHLPESTTPSTQQMQSSQELQKSKTDDE